MILLYLTLSNLGLLGCSGAAPIPTGPAEPAFVSSPQRRGTVDILLSSIITLLVCVYTSIHLNIVPPEKRVWKFPAVWVYKCYWVFIATGMYENSGASGPFSD